MLPSSFREDTGPPCWRWTVSLLSNIRFSGDPPVIDATDRAFYFTLAIRYGPEEWLRTVELDNLNPAAPKRALWLPR